MIAFADLLEAEGRSLRRGVLRLSAGLALAGMAALAGVAGLGLLLWALFRTLAVTWGVAVAAAVLGAIALVIAGLLAWTAARLAR